MKRLALAAAAMVMAAAFSTFAAFDAYMPVPNMLLLHILSIFAK